MIESKGNEISVPIDDWLYNQDNSGNFYNFTNIIYNLETKDDNSP